MRHLLNVEDTFALPQRGLLLVPDLPLPGRHFQPFAARVLMVVPDGGEFQAEAEFTLVHFRPGGYRLVLQLPGLGPGQVPAGSRVLASAGVHARLAGQDHDGTDQDAVAAALAVRCAGAGQRAEQLLLAAARSGSGHAAHELGSLYATGDEGVPADPAKARFWYQQALDSGFEASIASDPEWFKRPGLLDR